jgi:hypothetical protein
LKQPKKLTRVLKIKLAEMKKNPKEWVIASELPDSYVLAKRGTTIRMTVRR